MSPRTQPRAPPAAYLVDTNFYIRALRDKEFGDRFRAWHRDAIARLVLSAVVLHELLVGARHRQMQHVLEREYADEFRCRGRLIVPFESVWRRAADVRSTDSSQEN